MRAIRYMLIKEFKQIFRTREMVVIIFGLPVVQLIILGFTITNEVKNVSLIISDQDNSPVSREIVQSFENTDRFIVVNYIKDQKKIGESLQNWDAQIALIIPQGFGNKYERQQENEIQLLADGLDGNTAGIALGYAQGILADFQVSPKLKLQIMNKANHKVPSLVLQLTESGTIAPATRESRFWSAPRACACATVR